MARVVIFTCAATLTVASAERSTCSFTLTHPTTLPLAAGAAKAIDATHFVYASTGTTVSCTTDKRVDIQSAGVTEASAFLVNIPATYSKNSTETCNADSTSSACYQSSALAADKTNYPGYDTPALMMTCPASTTSDCSIQYEVDATCVTIIPATTPALATTPAPAGTPAPATGAPAPTSETPAPTPNVITKQTELANQATTYNSR